MAATGPFPVPEAGTEHHTASHTTVHVVFEVTVNVVLPATEDTFWLEGVTLRVGAAAVVNCKSLP